MSSLKILAAAIAAATFSLAFAQGTPPRPATNPAVGAGQRSTQNTPMGTTGTPGGSGGAMAQGGTIGGGGTLGTGSSMGAGGTAATTAGSAGGASGAMNSGTSAGAMPSGGGTAMAADTHTTHKAKAKKKSKKVAKTDRN